MHSVVLAIADLSVCPSVACWCFVQRNGDTITRCPVSGWLIEWGLTSHQTHYRSHRGRVFTGQMTQPTASVSGSHSDSSINKFSPEIWEDVELNCCSSNSAILQSHVYLMMILLTPLTIFVPRNDVSLLWCSALFRLPLFLLIKWLLCVLRVRFI